MQTFLNKNELREKILKNGAKKKITIFFPFMEYCPYLYCYHVKDNECEYMLSKTLALACYNYVKILYQSQEDWFNEIICCHFVISVLQDNKISHLFNENLSHDEINLLFAICFVESQCNNSVELIFILDKLDSYRIDKNFE